jgi:LSD1 subclass zinc finger protein
MSNDFNEATHNVAEQGKVKCKDCGGILQYSPGQNSLTCIYCGTLNEVEGASAPVVQEEQDFVAFLNNASAKQETIQTTTVKCGSCGSSTSLQPNVTSDSCPFCGTALVIQGGTATNSIRPAYLLPFSIDKKKGIELFQKWIAGLWWAPNDLKMIAKNDKLKGLYIPYWTYDSNTVSHYTGQQGTHYYVTESYTTTENGKTVTRTRQVQKTRWIPVSGTVHDDFDDVLVNASKSLPEKLANELEPWDLHELKAFNEQFLTGFITEQYQVDVKEGFEKAKVRMEVVIRGTVNKAIGGDVQRIDSLQTTYNNITFKHILLPIWLSAYRYSEKVYRFMINGRTGEVQGERPYSFWKIAGAVIGALAVIGGAIYLYMKMKHS